MNATARSIVLARVDDAGITSGHHGAGVAEYGWFLVVVLSISAPHRCDVVVGLEIWHLLHSVATHLLAPEVRNFSVWSWVEAHVCMCEGNAWKSEYRKREISECLPAVILAILDFTQRSHSGRCGSDSTLSLRVLCVEARTLWQPQANRAFPVSRLCTAHAYATSNFLQDPTYRHRCIYVVNGLDYTHPHRAEGGDHF